jgi:hypothetical protein
MNIDWAALGSVFGVSLVVTVALVGLFTLGIVGLSKQPQPAAQGGSTSGSLALRHRGLTGPDTPRVCPARCASAHTAPPQVKARLTGIRGAWWTAGAIYGDSRGSRCESGAVPPLSPGSSPPHRKSRLAQAGWKAGGTADPGARRLSPPVTSNQGADPE